MTALRAWRLLPTVLCLSAVAVAGGGGAPPAGLPGGLPAMTPTLASRVPPRYADVPYATLSAAQTLDVYLPAGSGPFPAVFMIHGGGFRFGDKQGWSAAVGRALLQAGYALVGVGYRLSGEATFPAAPQDVKAAVRFARANAATYHLDPTRFAAYGESAGGNLAALLGTTGNHTGAFDAPALGNAGVSSAVSAVADLYGPNDFAAIDGFLRAQGCAASSINHATAAGFESLYLGAALPTVPAKVKAANPITYVDAGDAPILIENGTQDCNVGFAQGGLLGAALDRAGVVNETVAFPQAAHGGAAFETTANAARIVAFFDRHLKAR